MSQVVAIDGPAASGKSSVARIVSQRLGFAYVNSGEFYRAVTWHMLRRGIDVHDAMATAETAEQAGITCNLVDGESHLLIDGVDPSEHLRDDDVNSAVSLVARVSRVRRLLVIHLRHCSAGHDVVMEGRDIGSVVFPNTPYKIYIDAPLAVRARRREEQGLRDEIAVRDQFDTLRRDAPLLIPVDAKVIDSSTLGIDEVVEKILAWLAIKGLRACSHSALKSEE